jgi:N-methylhydantoinase B
MPNIEDQEAEYPVLYLFRRHLQDSGGPGKFRGGRSGELAYTIYDAPTGQLEGLFAGTGAEMPNAIGIAGGLPGSAISIARVVKTDIKARIDSGKTLPDRLKAVDGELEWLICKHVRSPILAGDVWYHSWQGGGGYGDPLLRDPESVATDVARGAVSREVCADVYGVAMAPDGNADHGGTKIKREQIRANRKLSARKPAANGLNWCYQGTGRTEIADALVVDFHDKSVNCGNCGHRHCSTDENLLDHLGLIETHPSSAGPVRGEAYDRGRFKLRHLICQNCGGLTDVQVGLDGAPYSFAMPKLT